MTWLKDEKLLEVRKRLKHQKLDKFLNLIERFHLDLVKVFFTNMEVDGKKMTSHVKGVHMEITYVVWKLVAGIKPIGPKWEKVIPLPWKILTRFNFLKVL